MQRRIGLVQESDNQTVKVPFDPILFGDLVAPAYPLEIKTYPSFDSSISASLTSSKRIFKADSSFSGFSTTVVPSWVASL